ncbi:hypothetical protein ACQZV8_11290 [Magnetococcales bacterium HHB-1]
MQRIWPGNRFILLLFFWIGLSGCGLFPASPKNGQTQKAEARCIQHAWQQTAHSRSSGNDIHDAVRYANIEKTCRATE